MANPSVSFLGVDPGLARTGWAVIRPGDPVVLEASGLIATPSHMPSGQRLRCLFEATLSLLDKHAPTSLGIEQLFFLKSAKSIAATSQARGVILLASEMRGCPVREYNPTEVKMSLTGNGAALKPQIQRMVRILLCLKETLRPDDVADAAAIALCHMRTERFKARLAG